MVHAYLDYVCTACVHPKLDIHGDLECIYLRNDVLVGRNSSIFLKMMWTIARSVWSEDNVHDTHMQLNTHGII